MAFKRRAVIAATVVALGTGGAVAFALAGSQESNQGQRLPIQDYLLDSRQHDEVTEAYERLVQTCMRRHGVAGFTQPHGRQSQLGLLDRRYGLSDLAEARRYGYGLPPDKVSVPPAPPKLTAAQRALYSGSGTKDKGPSGCVGEALRDLGGASRPWNSPLATKLQLTSWKESGKDARVVAATRKWSACMNRYGYHFANPMDTPGRAKLTKDAEKALAVKEIECNRSSGFARAWFTAEAAYQKTLIERDKSALDHERTEALRSRDTAHSVLRD
ncbi:hypothetical protein [Streptomyces melanogenes]|uniref:hypothetical protein n=1 Tax=Streptomyces melanogenes TaxID=67326 RepID=UPI0037AB9AC8